VQAGSLSKALEILRSAQSEMWTLAQMEEYLGRLVEAEERYDGVSALSGERPAVRVMNLHRVKGLESPVVFLADPGGDVEHAVELHVDRSGPRILGYMAVWGEARGRGGAPLLACPPAWERSDGSERAFINAENLRLRYVAATRACSALVVTQRVAKGRSTNPWRWFLPFLDVQEIPDPGPQAAPAEPPEALAPGEADAARSGIVERLARCESPTYDVRAGKEYALSHPALFAPRAETGDAGGGAVEGVVGEAGEAGEGEHGQEWGTVIHLLLEAAAREPGPDLEALAAAALFETGQDAALAPAAAELVRTVMGSEVWKRSLAAAHRLTEVPFHYLLNEDIAGIPTLLRGSVDLAFEEDGGWVLVDYKTDLVSGAGQVEELGRRYAPQLRLYASAWEACTGQPVRETLLYFIRPATLLPV
jgi:ATP-dependent helicase/nuclease subunit A